MEILDDVGAADQISGEEHAAGGQWRRPPSAPGSAGTTRTPDAASRSSRAGGRRTDGELARGQPDDSAEPTLDASNRSSGGVPGNSRRAGSVQPQLTGLEQSGDAVLAAVRDNDSGERYEVTADYVIAADGGRTVPSLLGIEYEGLGTVSETAIITSRPTSPTWRSTTTC